MPVRRNQSVIKGVAILAPSVAQALSSSPPAAICRLCGSERVVEREWRSRYRYVQCVGCSLAFVVNPPSDDDVMAQYNRGTSSKLAYYRMASPADARSFRALLEMVERRALRGSILDVGCNIGTFVRVARDLGHIAEDQWEFYSLALANALLGFSDSAAARRVAAAFRAGTTPKGCPASSCGRASRSARR